MMERSLWDDLCAYYVTFRLLLNSNFFLSYSENFTVHRLGETGETGMENNPLT